MHPDLNEAFANYKKSIQIFWEHGEEIVTRDTKTPLETEKDLRAELKKVQDMQKKNKFDSHSQKMGEKSYL